MAQVTFIQNGQSTTVTAQDGQTLLQAALDNGINLDHACGGNGVCTTCMVKVDEGVENLSPVTDAEEMMGIADDPGMRLGCQAQIQGDTTVEIMF